MVPRTTTIGSYPVFPQPEDVEYYHKMVMHGVSDELIDPYLWSIEESIRDFTSSGIEIVSTGQTRGDLYSIFLDPKFVKGIAWDGAEIYVNDKIDRLSSIRLNDVKYARSILPKHFEIKEPITDAYTLAKFAKIKTDLYIDTKHLSIEINRKIVIPEIEDLQKEGLVSMIQLDSPSLAAESFPPEYIAELYEEVANVAKVPIVLHACGDTTRIFRLLTRLKVDVLSLDFYHYPKLMDEASKRNYDQQIGLGALDSQSPRVESVEEISSIIDRARKVIGDERIGLVHPHCGQRSLHREVAFEKNKNLTIARDDVYYGEAEEAKGRRLGFNEYDQRGYFLVTVKRESKEIIVTYYTYTHDVIKRYRAKDAESILQVISDDADILGISKRHLAYLTLELGRAEASLQSQSLIYRQRMIE